LWSFRLVDPDNRSPVDFALRGRLLAELRKQEGRLGAKLPAQLLEGWRDGRVKLWLTAKALELRRRRPKLFAGGDYLPLEVSGGKRDLVCAFARSGADGNVLLAVPRFFSRLCPVDGLPVGADSWGARGSVGLPPELPERWHNVLTGETVAAAGRPEGRGLRLAALFGRFPYALLEAEGRAQPSERPDRQGLRNPLRDPILRRAPPGQRNRGKRG
jgi:(1->4)-alpha-D-glucan 1-alpha-D-glucosylmutase